MQDTQARNMNDIVQPSAFGTPMAARETRGGKGLHHGHSAHAASCSATLRSLHNVQAGKTVGYELVLPPHSPTDYEHRAIAEGRTPLSVEVDRQVRLVHALRANRLLNNGLTLLLPIRPELPTAQQQGLGQLLDNLRDCALPAERLVLQMEESRAIADIEGGRQLILTLRARGYRVSISGFGSGFEGLRELVTCPPDFLRLSPELTNKLLSDRAQRSVVKAIIGVARDLNICVVADQVATSEAANLLHSMGVVLQQGPQYGPDRVLENLLSA